MQAHPPDTPGAHPAPVPPEAAGPRTVAAVQALTRVSRVLERASGGLGLAHCRVLAAVAAGDGRASRVAERLALGKPAVSASVDALCGRGLLVRAEVPGDQRAVQLSLTEAGRSALAGAEAAMGSALEGLLGRTGHREEVLDALCLLGVALERAAAERHQ